MSRRRLAVAGGAAVCLAASALAVAAAGVVRGRRGRPEPCGPVGVAEVLHGQMLNASPRLAIPTRLELVGDYLAVLDAASDSVLHVVNRHTGTLVRSLGRRGRGPGEFYGAWALDVAGGDSSIWVFDISLGRLTLVPLHEGVGGSNSPERWRMISLADGSPIMEARWLGPRTLLTTGLFHDMKAAVYDTTGRRIERIAAREARLASGERLQVYQTRLAMHPSKRLAALASRYESTLEVLSPRTGAVRRIDDPGGGHPPNEAAASLDRIAYVDVAVTATSIVALYSGRDAREYGARAPFGRCLQIFDWAGQLLNVFRLDGDVLALAVDADGRFVYALRHDPAPAVVRYMLPGREVAGPIAAHHVGGR